MSTKITIVCGSPDHKAHPPFELKTSEDFHFYAEMHDEEFVHLELVRPLSEYVATAHYVRVGIPCQVMDAIAEAWVARGRAMVDGQAEGGADGQAEEKKP